jgi:Xaa-Pro aminopeptidase
MAALQQLPAAPDALLITHLPDVRWLTGFTGSNAAVALRRGAKAVEARLFTDGRYTAQARAQARGLAVSIDKKSSALCAAEWLVSRGTQHCGFDRTHTTVASFDALRKSIPSRQRRSFFEGADGVVARLREIKDAGEIAVMKRAAKIGCKLYETLLAKMRPGMRETDVAALLEGEARRHGAEAMSFETIVASGKRSSLPHGRASTERLPARGFVTLDFGVLVEGYCSDMTRTVHLGKATAAESDVYDAVLEAQTAAVRAVRAGVTCDSVDQAARSVLQRRGYAKFFTHSTGHGVGLEIHEGPRLAAKQEQRLEAGMIVTIEPGAYLPGNFGVRIEDMVLVTAGGGDVITRAAGKELVEL